MDEKKERIDQLVLQLNAASEAYYGGREELLSNFEWDALFDELSNLETEIGYLRTDSPTQTTGHSDAEAGEKEQHEFPALSLAKTKDVAALQAWAGERAVWLSWKLDGLTLVLSYDDGILTKILTRGNGTVGTNITYMKDVLFGFPKNIKEKGHLVVRGEATISYPDFERINDTLEEDDEKYANPRNLASGTLALDRTNIHKVRERNVNFHAFTLVYTEKPIVSWGWRMDFLDQMGFQTVQREKTDAAGLPDAVKRWTALVDTGKMDRPVDGLVITYDDTAYAAEGSVTGHHATRAGLAFKWQDVSAITTLDHIEWSCAASIITPVAVFDPVQLEGTTVSRASLCNISELDRLGVGADRKTRLEVIKANKIIPKCIAVLETEGRYTIPERCPVCGERTEIRKSGSGIQTLRCTNPRCPAKQLKRFNRFVSKSGMDIEGLSIQTLLVFINKGFLSTFADIYHLQVHYNEIVKIEGFGEKSCNNLMAAIEKSRNVDPVNFLYALSIPMIGIDAGKKIIGALGTQGLFQRMENGEDFEDIDGIGPEKSNAIMTWFSEKENQTAFYDLLQELHVVETAPKEAAGGACAGQIFVVTGNVHVFSNRNALKQYVEDRGGKVTGSVSPKTTYLVNNDLTSTSSKNQKARELGIPILSEEQFVEMFGQP